MAVQKKKVGKNYIHYETISEETAKWKIILGELARPIGRPAANSSNLFQIVAEKIPWLDFTNVRDAIKNEWKEWSNGKFDGVYVAHDSMSNPTYIGHGNVFNRISARFREHPDELKYFSFYIMDNKAHERDIETLLIHICGSLLQMNTKKKELLSMQVTSKIMKPVSYTYESIPKEEGTRLNHLADKSLTSTSILVIRHMPLMHHLASRPSAVAFTF